MSRFSHSVLPVLKFYALPALTRRLIFDAEQEIGLYAEFFVQFHDAVVTRLLFSVQPLPNGRLIYAEPIRKLLSTQIIQLHQFLDNVLKWIHINIMCQIGSKVLARVS